MFRNLRWPWRITFLMTITPNGKQKLSLRKEKNIPYLCANSDMLKKMCTYMCLHIAVRLVLGGPSFLRPPSTHPLTVSSNIYPFAYPNMLCVSKGQFPRFLWSLYTNFWPAIFKVNHFFADLACQIQPTAYALSVVCVHIPLFIGQNFNAAYVAHIYA